jgi:broad specificity phosphatase PhoE
MSLNIYFLRHGETTYSQSGSYCGITDAELTPAGLEMAQAFGEAYQSLTWEAIYCSPMKRTIATARPLCEKAGLEMQLRDGLKEINYGDWEDKTQPEVKAKYAEEYEQWLIEPAWNPPTNGETAVQIASRASLVITEIEQSYAEGNVLVVSHKATIRVMLCSLLGIDLGRYRDRIDMPAASVSIIKFGLYGPMLQSLGDRNYMGDELRNRPGT